MVMGRKAGSGSLCEGRGSQFQRIACRPYTAGHTSRYVVVWYWSPREVSSDDRGLSTDLMDLRIRWTSHPVRRVFSGMNTTRNSPALANPSYPSSEHAQDVSRR